MQLHRKRAMLELLLEAWQQSGRRRLWGPAVDAALRNALVTLKQVQVSASGALGAHKAPCARSTPCTRPGGMQGAAANALDYAGNTKAQTQGEEEGGNQNVGRSDAGMVAIQEVERTREGGGRLTEQDDASDEEGHGKAGGLDASALLEARSLQRVAASCVKVLKDLLMTDGKMD